MSPYLCYSIWIVNVCVIYTPVISLDYSMRVCVCKHEYVSVSVCVCVIQGVGAVSVLKECARMRPEDPSLPMLAAKVCIGQLHWVNDTHSLSLFHDTFTLHAMHTIHTGSRPRFRIAATIIT